MNSSLLGSSPLVGRSLVGRSLVGRSLVGRRIRLWRVAGRGVLLGTVLCGALAGGVAQAGTVRISQTSAGVQGNQATYANSEASMSADGTKILFESYASNLVSGDTNNATDVFVKDLKTGVITRVSTDSSGAEGNDRFAYAVISADGTKVAFQSDASNLVSDDTNNRSDVFVKDLSTGATTRVSVDSSGAQGNLSSYNPNLSADGTLVSFDSDASNLVSGDTNSNGDVFVRNLTTGVTTLVSADSNGVQGNNFSYNGIISGDGNHLAFESDAANLVSGDTNGRTDVFVKDLNTGVVTLASVDSNGVLANNSSYDVSISADGSKVVFESTATNLAGTDTNNRNDVFLHDFSTGATTCLSINSNGDQANGSSTNPIISANGTKVTFRSYASNLVSGDTNSEADVLVRDLNTGVITRVNLGSGGVQANAASAHPFINADGTKVVYYSEASNLVSGDTNGYSDEFAVDVVTPSVSIGDASVTEPNSGYTNAVFTVSLSASSVVPVTVQYSVASGTTSDNDYRTALDSDGGTPGTLTIPAGAKSGTITVPINGDRREEDDETFFVNLSSPNGATISDDQGVGTIINNDHTPTAIKLSRQSIKEHSGVGAFVAGLSATDADAGDKFVFSLPPETDDNNFFTIDGTNLRAAQDFDFATKSSYTITIAVSDLGDNGIDQQFVISVLETTKPTVSISAPASNAKFLIQNFVAGVLNGTASDNVGVTAVKVRLSRKRDNVNQYWNGSNFVTYPSTVDADLTGDTSATWSLSSKVPPASKLDGGTYTVQVYALDGAGNKSAYANSTLILIQDVTAPSVSITNPTQSQLVDINSLGAGALRGTASDNRSVTSVKLKLQRKRGTVTEYWNGSEFTTTVALVDATYSNGNWSYNTAIPASKLDKGAYTLYATAYDEAGNFTTTPSRSFNVTGTATGGDATVSGAPSGGRS